MTLGHEHIVDQGPVAQSIVSLSSSLMTNSLIVVAKVFFLQILLLFLLQKNVKNVSSFCNA